MWILVLLSVAIGDPPHSRFSPAFHSIEFLTRESCESAKAVLDKAFGSEINKLNEVYRKPGDGGSGAILRAVDVSDVMRPKIGFAARAN
jgi:hypothetical protein